MIDFYMTAAIEIEFNDYIRNLYQSGRALWVLLRTDCKNEIFYK